MSTHNTGCGSCAEAATLACVGCHDIRDCGKDCQQKDWNNHKYLCSTFEDFRSRPSPLYRRAILLGASQNSKPEFVWVKVEKEDVDEDGEADYEVGFDEEYEVNIGESEGAMEVPLMETFLRLEGSHGCPLVKPITIVLRKLGKGQLLDHVIHVWYREDFSADGSQFNECFQKLTPGNMEEYWRGPLLFVGTSKVQEPRLVKDLDTADLSIAFKGLLYYQQVLQVNRAFNNGVWNPSLAAILASKTI
ncbi:putative Zinc finger, MYND-type [Septoria linicola]|nr:putative Zinc finger, MYND-type [Septoria linicola]